MSRRDRDALGSGCLVLVFIAGSVREAERAEAALTSAGIDYSFEAQDFTQGILSSSRAGVGFCVIEGQAPLRATTWQRLSFIQGSSMRTRDRG